MAENNIPHFVLPTSKFIQVYIDKEPYFRFGPVEHNYHCWMLEIALKEFGITPSFRKEGERNIAIESGDRYELVGAGRMLFSRVHGDYVLFNSSQDYGLGPDKQHLVDLSFHLPERIKFRINPD